MSRVACKGAQTTKNPAGYSLGGETVPQSNINAFVQDAINEIQFVTGDASTNQWAKLRAQYGRTEPYKVKYIEIGNEDFFVSTIISFLGHLFS